MNQCNTMIQLKHDLVQFNCCIYIFTSSRYKHARTAVVHTPMALYWMYERTRCFNANY